MGALKPIFDWDTPSSYDELSGVVQVPTLEEFFATYLKVIISTYTFM